MSPTSQVVWRSTGWLVKEFFRMSSSSIKDSSPVVTVVEGILRGRVAHSVRGNTKYYSFQGVPYAEPPVGHRRFNPPETLKPWTGVKEAVKEGPSCPNIDFGQTEIKAGSNEDCLYLNIYTSQLPEKKGSLKLPVLVWIHGGGFRYGSGDADLYSPDYLVQKDVVIVTINYRLGALGFLCLQNKLCPGNNGLRDQMEALRWVQRNIINFGGDPDNVTIFGQSAGGASVQFHMLSPLSKGLFHRAITHSGSVLDLWAMSRHPVRAAFLLAELLGKKTTDDKELLDFLKTVPAEDIVMKSQKLPRMLEPNNFFVTNPFTPCVEPDLPGAFLSVHPATLLKEGKIHDVPYILGVNSLEGLIMFKVGKAITEPANKAEWERLIPSFPNLQKGTTLGNSILERIKSFYFGKGFSRESYADVLSWEYFLMGNNEILKSIAAAKERKSDTYFYHFTYEGGMNIFKTVMGCGDWKGTLHGDELSYLFYCSMLGLTAKPGSDDEKMVDILTEFWTDFAKFGNPTPKTKHWKPFTASEKDYLEINLKPTLKNHLHKKEAEFWGEIYSEVCKITNSKL